MAAMSARDRSISFPVVLAVSSLVGGCAPAALVTDDPVTGATWLAGDHHVHTEHSLEWDKRASPPTPILGGDARYPVDRMAREAQRHGLDWMVVTDHGGPLHSEYVRNKGWAALEASRQAVPGLVQFHGIEMDVPGAKHATVIMPVGPNEADALAVFERGFARKDAWPEDKARDREALMLDALTYAAAMPSAPVIIANHPGRSAPGPGHYDDVTPDELRRWQDRAPSVVIGMEGAPGHQAMTLKTTANPQGKGWRGDYDRYPTMGGFDLFTAQVGGVWDALLGEGRRFWITASSDAHIHVSDGGGDFWPGEYAKTYVFAEKTPDAILAGLKAGQVFVTTGDLITGLQVTASVVGPDAGAAGLGGTLMVAAGDRIQLRVRFRDPAARNANGDDPLVRRVDLIRGEIGTTQGDTNPGTKVTARYTAADWQQNGDWRSFTWTSEPVTDDFYLRLRGTATGEQEPAADTSDDDPWADLWFYGNPVFIRVQPSLKGQTS